MKYGSNTAALHTNGEDSAELQQRLMAVSPWLGAQGSETLALEASMNAIDGGAGCAAFSSEWGAWRALLGSLCRQGGNALVSRRLCAASQAIIGAVLKELGAEIKYIDSGHPCQTQKTIDDGTCAVIAPTLAVSAMSVAALESIARIADRWGVPFIADNSLATPALCTPAARGAHVVITSAAGFIAESGRSGVCFVTDAGTFNWKKNADKFPAICAADDKFAETVFAEAFPKAPLAARLRMLSMRCGESGIAQADAVQLGLSLATLPLRMERQSASALAAATLLEASPAVREVSYPGLESHKQNDMAAVYLKGGSGAVLTFELAGGEAALQRFIAASGFIKPAANAGGPRTVIFRAGEAAAGAESVAAASQTLCLSVGLEDIEDIKAELDKALTAALDK